MFIKHLLGVSSIIAKQVSQPLKEPIVKFPELETREQSLMPSSSPAPESRPLSLDSVSRVRIFLSVLVSEGCHTNCHTGWLKTTEMDDLKVLKARSCKGVGRAGSLCRF